MADRLLFTVSDDLAALAPLAEAVERLVEETGMPMETAFQINLCLDELITNSVHHGAVEGQSVRVDVVLAMEPEGLMIRLTDNGIPYDPFDAPEPDLDLEIEDRPIGGLGVHFVRSFMDRTEYRRDGETNVVTLWKRPPAG